MTRKNLCISILGICFILCTAFTAAQQFNDTIMKGMKWRLVGPLRGGRVLAVTGIPGDPYTFYFGGVAGGVWRTTDGGINWTPLTDKEPFASIGAIAVAESNPSVIYVGTGESCIRGNISYGNGVYKSTDGGKSWNYIGLKDTQHIARLWVNPRNPDIVFVAALGHAYGPNPDRGRSSQSQRDVRRALSGAADAVELGQRRPRQRPVSLRGWRAHLEAP
jgi:hypothetical protein